MKVFITLLYFLSIGGITPQICQNVKIEGSAQITQMDNANEEEQLVVRTGDGTLAVRSVSSLPSNESIDTTKNLASDFELAKHLCECGTNLPPFLINSLLASGYTEQQLIDAGISFTDIYNAKPIMDADGNQYSSIEIGTQTWLRENLKTTKYNDGSNIPLVTSSGTWSTTSTNEDPAYCWYNNNISNKDNLGALYNWYALSSTTNGNKNVCPIGWHMANGSDWNTINSFLGFGSIAGKAMKENTLEFWNSINGATNSSGFNARGNGRRNSSGSFSTLYGSAYWWDSTEVSSANAERAYLAGSTSYLYVNGGSANKTLGYGVRCVKD